MSLLTVMQEACTKLVKTGVQDGLGGFYYDWVDGSTFSAVIVKTGHLEAITAEVPNAEEQYTVIVQAGTTLDFHDVFRRTSDGATFRVTGYVRDSEAPSVSTIQIAKVTAERWEITE